MVANALVAADELHVTALTFAGIGEQPIVSLGMAWWAAIYTDGRAQQYTPPLDQMSDEEILVVLGLASTTMNTELPKQLDQFTVLLTTTAGPGREFSFHYRLPHHLADETDLEGYRNIMEPRLLAVSCADPARIHLMKANVRFNFVFFDRDHTPLYQFIATASGCE